MIFKALLYFAAGFTFLNIWLYMRLRRLKGSADESVKLRAVLAGLVGHFVFSLLVLLVYYRLLFADFPAEVIIAVSAYMISFIHYIAVASRLK